MTFELATVTGRKVRLSIEPVNPNSPDKFIHIEIKSGAKVLSRTSVVIGPEDAKLVAAALG